MKAKLLKLLTKIVDFSNMHLCWLIRSTSKDEKVRLEVQQSFLQPRSFSGEWTDYLLVADGKLFELKIFMMCFDATQNRIVCFELKQ